jgi:hypothetical protein
VLRAQAGAPTASTRIRAFALDGEFRLKFFFRNLTYPFELC